MRTWMVNQLIDVDKWSSSFERILVIQTDSDDEIG